MGKKKKITEMINSMQDVLGHPGLIMETDDLLILHDTLTHIPATDDFLWSIIANVELSDRVRGTVFRNPALTADFIRMVLDHEGQYLLEGLEYAIVNSACAKDVDWVEEYDEGRLSGKFIAALGRSDVVDAKTLVWVESLLTEVDAFHDLYKNLHYPDERADDALREWMQKDERERAFIVDILLKRQSVRTETLLEVITYLGTDECRDATNTVMRGEMRRKIMRHSNNDQNVLQRLLQGALRDDMSYSMLKPFVLAQLSQYPEFAGYPDEWIEAQIIGDRT